MTFHFSACNTAAPAQPSRGTRPARTARPGYCRAVQLPKLIAMWPHEIADRSAQNTARIVARLRQALRQERRKGRAGHWAYDLSRHMALVEALKAETAKQPDQAP